MDDRCLKFVRRCIRSIIMITLRCFAPMLEIKSYFSLNIAVVGKESETKSRFLNACGYIRKKTDVLNRFDKYLHESDATAESNRFQSTVIFWNVVNTDSYNDRCYFYQQLLFFFDAVIILRGIRFLEGNHLIAETVEKFNSSTALTHMNIPLIFIHVCSEEKKNPDQQKECARVIRKDFNKQNVEGRIYIISNNRLSAFKVCDLDENSLIEDINEICTSKKTWIKRYILLFISLCVVSCFLVLSIYFALYIPFLCSGDSSITRFICPSVKLHSNSSNSSFYNQQ